MIISEVTFSVMTSAVKLGAGATAAMNTSVLAGPPTGAHTAEALLSIISPIEADVYLLGTGVSFPAHLSLQALQILTSCRVVFTNLPEADLTSLPDTLRSKCVSIWSLYRDNRERTANYRDVTDAIIEAASRERPLAWLTPGHPIVFDSVTQALLNECPARGWRVRLVPAISSIDTVLADIGYDPANGLIVHEATSLVMQHLPLCASFATVLLQPAAFGSHQAHLTLDWRPDLRPLRDYLVQFYPPDHICAFIRSSSGEAIQTQVSWYKLDDLPLAAIEEVGGSTLFVPPFSTAAS